MISDSQQKMHSEIKEVYAVLLKYGFPGLVSSTFSESVQQIQQLLSDYFQPTLKRQNLIEWLILNINTLYAQELESKTNKKRRIAHNLWKLGVMPYSKHTMNLDYEKYVEGLLGYQQAINLIHTLCRLLKESKQFDKSKEDHKFYTFLDEIVNNFDILVNLDYDPYKISFPAAYQSLSDEQFDKQYEQTFTKLTLLKEKQGMKETQNITQKTKVQDVFSHFEQNKAQFSQKYSNLIQKIRSTLHKNESLIANYTQGESSKSRTLQISQTLPKLYRQYKQRTKLAKVSVSRLSQQRKSIQTLIQSLNENVRL